MSFDRPKLKYEVVAKAKEPMMQLGQLVKDRFTKIFSIVYCLSKNEYMEVSKFLYDICKIKTVYYHADLGVHQKFAVQKKWRAGEVCVVSATIAFGMGIHTPEVPGFSHSILTGIDTKSSPNIAHLKRLRSHMGSTSDEFPPQL